MKDKTIKFNFINIFYYLLGFVLVGLGVNLMDASALGMGAWDTVTFNIFSFLTEKLGIETVNLGFDTIVLKPGHVSMMISLTILTVVLLYRRKISLIFMLVPVFFIGSFINMWYLLFDGYQATHIFLQSVLFISGLLTIPLGLVFVVKSTFPAFVFEEWTFMMADVFKTDSFAKVRLGIEILGISIGITFGAITYLSLGHLGAVNIGSIITAYVFGPIMAYELKVLGVTKGKTTVKEDLIELRRELKDMIRAVRLELKPSRVIKYIIGMGFIAFGVVMMIRSDLGNSSWDTLHWSLHKFTGITVGEATIYVALFFTFMVMSLNKHIKYVLMVIPIFSVGYLIDLFNLYLLVDFEVTTLAPQILAFIAGLLLLPMGGALLIISTYPAGVFDEFMYSIMRKLNTNNLILVRVIMELTAVITALIIGYFAGIGFGKVGVGTLIFSLSVGWLIKNIIKLYERIGLVETKQTN